jgi:hypothetical protein
MPGTTKLEFYTMPLADALSIIMADKDDLLTLGKSAADVDELRHAARVVVEQHAAVVARHYVPEPGERAALRVVTNHDDQWRSSR